MKLIIFDLDQTLVDVVHVHDRTAAAVFKRFFGIEGNITEVEFAGRSLSENFLAVAKLKGLPEKTVLEKMPAMLDYYDRVFVESMPRNCSECVLPGVRELLQALTRDGNLLALYTGDSRVVARTILERTGLEQFFRSMFFGTETKRRADMIGKAIEAAMTTTGRTFSGSDIVIVGDSIKDIEAGKEYGVRTVAVATGLYSESELRQHGADFVFKDMSRWTEVMKAILNQ